MTRERVDKGENTARISMSPREFLYFTSNVRRQVYILIAQWVYDWLRDLKSRRGRTLVL